MEKPDILKQFKEWNRIKKNRIAVGVLKDHPVTVESLKKLKDEIDIVIVGPTKIDGFEWIESTDARDLVRLAHEKKVDAIFRGNFDAVAVYDAIHDVTGYSGPINTVALVYLEKINSIIEKTNLLFSITPFSASNDKNLASKIAGIDINIEFFESFGIKPRIGVLSAGKPTDVLEGVAMIDKTLVEAEFLVNWYARKGYEIKHFNHQVEYAVQESEVIIAPDSISGNQIGRSMFFFGHAYMAGSIAVNLPIIYSHVPEAFRDWSTVLPFLNGYLNRPENK